MKNFPRAPLAVLASTVLAVGAVACGGSGSSHSTSAGSSGAAAAHASATPSGGYLKEDADEDGDDPHPTDPGQDDQEFLASYGPKASPATASTITALVRSYYTASLAGDGTRACALLNAALATSLAKQQSPTASGAQACAAAIAPLLAQQHQRLLAEEPATMTVIGVYVKGILGLVVLGFGNAPESDIVVTREGGAWKIDALYDSLIR
jgi:hypothetical protein